MLHEYLSNSEMSAVHGMSNYRSDASRYRVYNSKIIEAANKLESTKEEWDTPLVEPLNKHEI